jgi:hypothetical protein
MLTSNEEPIKKDGAKVSKIAVSRLPGLKAPKEVAADKVYFYIYIG